MTIADARAALQQAELARDDLMQRATEGEAVRAQETAAAELAVREAERRVVALTVGCLIHPTWRA